MRPIRRLVFAASLLILVAGSGCESTLEDEQKLLRAIEATRLEPREFEFSFEGPEEGFNVTGAFQDEFRYRASLATDGAPVMEQIISDDALAIRVTAPDQVPWIQIPPLESSAGPTLDALRAGTWVTDPAGAPPLGSEARPDDEESAGLLGVDPLQEGLDILVYVRNAVRQAASVKEFEEDDLQPTYQPSEDHFPKPDDNLGVRRYDLRRLTLPRRLQTGTRDPGPRPAHFRKMAVYVRNNRVVEVREEIDFESHPDMKEAKRTRRSKYLLDVLQQLREGKTQEKVVASRFTLKINLNEELQIEAPAEGLVSNLRIFLAQDIDLTGEEPTPSPAAPPSPAVPDASPSP